MRRLARIGLLLLSLPLTVHAGGGYDLPPLPPAHQYGTLLLDRVATQAKVKPVIFSHWLHRIEASCRICHGELGFELHAGDTPITETENRAGRYCGACHDGGIAFALAENCARCHTGNRNADLAKFELFNKKPFPASDFGNGIDWVKAFRRGLIAPAGYLFTPGSAMLSDKTVVLEAGIGRVPPAIFPHAPHGDWLDCNACHPVPFELRPGGRLPITKAAILKGEYCGICHLAIAFPINDCPRCHPGIH